MLIEEIIANIGQNIIWVWFAFTKKITLVNAD